MGTQGVTLPLPPTPLLTHCAGEPFVFALDGGDERSWGSGLALVGFRPRATLHVTASGTATVRTMERELRWSGDPFALLDRFRAEFGPTDDLSPAASGGILVALSYELRHCIERLPQRTRTTAALPVLYAAAYDWLLSYSYAEQRYTLSSASYSNTELRSLAQHIEVLSRQAVQTPLVPHRLCAVPDWQQEEYEAAVRVALDYIGAGDVYQVNLAQRLTVAGGYPPPCLFAALQQINAVPFAAYVDAGDVTLVSNSPECFLTLQGQTLSTFPIKGTRPRGPSAAADRALVHALMEDPKERAEHVMIVDLERNDLGRVCRTGSVRVEEFARVCTFPTLHHMVSTVRGALQPACGLTAVLRALFPGGSITGAPKIRAMEIIDELEPMRRDFYTGAIGFIAANGDAVFNLAIRTATVTREQMTYCAGGGIVADSVPEREYAETLLKARPFLTALMPPPP